MEIRAKEAAALETIVMSIYGSSFLFGRRAGSRLSLLSAAHSMIIRLVCSPRQLMHLQTPSMSEAQAWCYAESPSVAKAQEQNGNVRGKR